MKWAADLGFDMVEYVRVNAENVQQEVERFSEKIKDFDASIGWSCSGAG